jgi:hypothetical protein
LMITDVIPVDKAVFEFSPLMDYTVI